MLPLFSCRLKTPCGFAARAYDRAEDACNGGACDFDAVIAIATIGLWFTGGMTETQLWVLVSISCLWFVLNGGLYIFLGRKTTGALKGMVDSSSRREL